jgi:CHAT domain-containing protein
MLMEGPCGEGRAVAPAVAGLRDIQAALEEDQALLGFQLETSYDKEMYEKSGLNNPWGGSWLLVVTRSGARAVRIPDRGELAPVIQMFLGLVERRDGSEDTGAGKLHRWLLADALDGLPPGVRRLVIVPDGPLFQVPFGALRPGAGQAPLAADYQIAVVPSASLWRRWQAAERRKPRLPVLALADPALPDATRDAATRGSGIFRAGLTLGRLPRARDEARAVVSHLGSESRLAEGDQATERLLKTAPLGDYGVLHLAAHAVVDDRHPHRSAVVLAAGAEDEDGLLQPPEIAALDMEGLVVILSTCSSARGEILEGEGAMSLARSFFQGGARAVVGNLWPLRDDEAARLIDDFTAHLADGKSLGAALSATQRDWIRAGKPAAAWAGLLLQGDADLVPFPGGRRVSGRFQIFLALGICAAAGCALAWWSLRRRRRSPVS